MATEPAEEKKKIRAARDEGRRGAASDAGQTRENTAQISEARGGFGRRTRSYEDALELPFFFFF